MKNLFGDETEESKNKTPKHLLSKYQLFKKHNDFREGFGKYKCEFCRHCIGIGYHNKVYYKCKLMGISNSEATDIRLKNLCNQFQEE